MTTNTPWVDEMLDLTTDYDSDSSMDTYDSSTESRCEFNCIPLCSVCTPIYEESIVRYDIGELDYKPEEQTVVHEMINATWYETVCLLNKFIISNDTLNILPFMHRDIVRDPVVVDYMGITYKFAASSFRCTWINGRPMDISGDIDTIHHTISLRKYT